MNVTQLGEEPVAAARQRLRKIEGQVRGIQRMLDEDQDCEQVLRQVAAASKALRRVGVHLAVHGLEHCVIDGDGDPDLEQFRKSFVELT